MILRIVILLLTFFNAGYMVFDGMRAMITGDYIRPKAGEYAGQLGPWTKIAEAIGIDPMSGLMKMIFVVVGIYGLIAGVLFAGNHKNGWLLLLIFCIVSAWNLMFGTMSSLIVLVLLLIYKLK
jgi:hypothetical protein